MRGRASLNNLLLTRCNFALENSTRTAAGLRAERFLEFQHAAAKMHHRCQRAPRNQSSPMKISDFLFYSFPVCDCSRMEAAIRIGSPLGQSHHVVAMRLSKCKRKLELFAFWQSCWSPPIFHSVESRTSPMLLHLRLVLQVLLLRLIWFSFSNERAGSN